MDSSRSREEESIWVPGIESARALGGAQDCPAGSRTCLHTCEMGFVSLGLCTPELDRSCLQTWMSQAGQVTEITGGLN